MRLPPLNSMLSGTNVASGLASMLAFRLISFPWMKFIPTVLTFILRMFDAFSENATLSISSAR